MAAAAVVVVMVVWLGMAWLMAYADGGDDDWDGKDT